MTRGYLIIVLVFLAVSASAEVETVGFIGAEKTRKYDELHQYGLQIRYPLSPRWQGRWAPRTLDISAGFMDASDKTATYVSVGPSWRHEVERRGGRQWFMDFGIHPTLISRSNFDDTQIGGGFHFTSHFGIGMYLSKDRKTSLMIQYQHTSNAGLRDRNPGIDMVAVIFHK